MGITLPIKNKYEESKDNDYDCLVDSKNEDNYLI